MTSTQAERVLADRLDFLRALNEGRGSGKTTIMVRSQERDRVKALAARLQCNHRVVISLALDVLEATLKTVDSE